MKNFFKKLKFNRLQSRMLKIFNKNIDNISTPEGFAICIFTGPLIFMPKNSLLLSHKYALYDVMMTCSVYAGELLARKWCRMPSFDRREVFHKVSKCFKELYSISDRDIQCTLSSRVPIIEDIVFATPPAYRNMIIEKVIKECINIASNDLSAKKMNNYDSKCTMINSIFSNVQLSKEVSVVIHSVFSSLESMAEQVPYYTDYYTGRDS